MQKYSTVRKNLNLTAIFATIAIFIFAACNSDNHFIKPKTTELGKNETNIIVPSDVKYIRWGSDGGWDYNREEYPPTIPPILLKSEKEWDNYLTPLKNHPFQYAYDGVGNPVIFSLQKAVDAYDSDFFIENNLVVIRMVEGSSSIRHSVESIVIEGNELQVLIKRHIPLAGWADMAYWHIFIPVKRNDFNGNLVKVDVVDEIIGE